MYNRLHFIFFVLFCLFTEAQEKNNYKFKRIGEDQGLSNNWSRSFYQDDQGFIWIGTADGLNRFDGYECKTYRPSNKSGFVFGNFSINNISKKNKNELWIATSNGLYTFKNNRLKLFKELPRTGYSQVLNENDHIAWVASSDGLLRIDHTNSSIINLSTDPAHKFHKRKVHSMYLDSKKNIWFGATGSIFRYNTITKEIKEYTDFENLDTQTKNDILCITEDRSGTIWIGFGQNGVYYLNSKKRSDTFNKYSEGVIIDLHVDKDNQLWIGRGSNMGLDKIDLNKNENPVTYTYDISNPNSISDNSIFSIYEDKSGDLWIGTFGGAVNYLSKRDKKIHTLQQGLNDGYSIHSNLVNSIVEDEEFIWIGTEGGLERLNKKNRSIAHYKYEDGNKNSLSRDPIQNLYKDSKGYLWIGIWDGGLNRFDPKTANFTRYQASNKKGGIQSNNVLAILEDSKKRLWIGTSGGGLYKYNYHENNFESFIHNPKNPKSIPSNYITQLQETHDGQILFTTYHSINFFNPETNSFTNDLFSLKTDGEATSVLCSFIDSNNKIWVGTNIGLYTFDRTTRKFNPFKSKGLIKNISVKAIIEDNNKDIWVSTSNGLFKIDKKQQEITKLTKQDGLTSNDFKGKSAYKNDKGILYFGTSNGLNYFDPNELIRNQNKPNIAITTFAILQSKPNQNKQFQSIVENPNTKNEISLSYKQNSFVISYTGLNYLHPEKNEYQYKLMGYDEIWINAKTNRNATYTNVKSGTYTFMVRGSNNDGEWSEVSKNLVLKINSPWYDTMLFKISLALFFLLSILTFYFLRISFLKNQRLILKEKVTLRTEELRNTNRLLQEKTAEIELQNLKLSNQRYHLEELVNERTYELQKAKLKAEESDRLKSAIVANVSHEIRTPMNAIYGFSSLLNDEKVTKEERAEYVEIISQNCESLLVIIDDILDISVLDTKGTKLMLKPTNVSDLLNKLKRTYQQKETRSLKITFEEKPNQDSVIINTDVVRLKQILTNLLNNAVKFTEKGTVNFGFNIKENHLVFHIKDTGIGINEKDLKTIFDPFFKADNNDEKVYRGTGIGLSISEKLVHTFKGEIWVKSTFGKGTTFYVKIPTNI